eukprot:gene16477-3972_t
MALAVRVRLADEHVVLRLLQGKCSRNGMRLQARLAGLAAGAKPPPMFHCCRGFSASTLVYFAGNGVHCPGATQLPVEERRSRPWPKFRIDHYTGGESALEPASNMRRGAPPNP